MKYLIDANVWLDLILIRSGRAEVLAMLAAIPNRLLITTDFAVHASGIFVANQNPSGFLTFLEDLIKNEVGILHLPPTALRNVVSSMAEYSLTFDDAFQYEAAVRFDLQLVSFDSDFDHTPRGRLTPAQAVEHYHGTQQP